MSDRDRGAWCSDGVVALRCAVLPAVEVGRVALRCVGVAGCWRWSNQQYFLIFFQDVQRETKVVFLLYTILIFYSRYTIELCYR